MFASTQETKPAKATLRLMTGLIAALLAFAAFTPSAGAIEGPTDWETVPEGEDPWVLVPGITAILGPTASVEVSCATETATVTVENETTNFYPISVEVDGALADNVNLGGNQVFVVEVPLAENDQALIEVFSGDDDILSTDVERDCLLPDPSYEIFSDCGIEQAYVRLTNSGDDVANMAVQYHPNPFASQPILPGDSLDWPLVVAPNDTVDFTVRAGLDALGVESFTFACATPEPTPPAPTPEPPAPTPTPEPPAPTPEPQPTPVADPATEEVTGQSSEQVDGPDEDAEQDALALDVDSDDEDGEKKTSTAATTASSGIGGFFKALVGLMLAAGVGIFVVLFARRRDEKFDPMASV